ncbi:MAG TPA: hypothetical protein VLB69_03315 [Rudaea sp.]|nr:hypothetical protein [Rudaea sp.]
MKRILVASMLGCSVLAAASSAVAGQGYLVANVTLRAGPDMGYPGVVGLSAGTPVGIEGCVDGWSWCDVTTGMDRGWVPANYLQEEYEGRRVFVPAYGVQIGIPIVSFVFGSYWDDYYHDRSWYGHREHWSHVHPRYSSYGGSHGTAYGSSYGGSHGTSYGGGAHYAAPSQAQTSSPYRTSGSRQATVVTTQPAYQSGRTRTVRRDGYTQSASQVRQTGSVAHADSAATESRPTWNRANPTAAVERARQNHVNRAPASERNMNPPRSASGEQHSAAGQARASEVHDRNLARSQQKTMPEHNRQAPKAQHKDARPENDHGGGKDKNRN